MRAFNRRSEDISLLFKPKAPTLFWFEVEKKKEPEVVDAEIQDQIDTIVLWALQEYCTYSFSHTMTFIKVLNKRRVEFSRKCARILMDYADFKPVPEAENAGLIKMTRSISKGSNDSKDSKDHELEE